MGPLIAVLVTLLLADAAGARSEACTSARVCRDELVLSTGGSVRYYRTRPLSRDEAIQLAVIVVHGNRRDADRYYDDIVAAARAEERLRDTLLLAPSFRTLDDRPAPNEHYWSSHGWKIGNKSRDPKRVSSFTVMNELLAKVCSKKSLLFPNLETVVIIGHSAGGQFVNRYAAGAAGCSNSAVGVRYVVMNPSSYLYVDGRRRSENTDRFEVPGSGCREYDDYKYGLRDLNAYMKSVGADRIRTHLFQRRSYFLAGEEDTRLSGSLDTRCQANLQGPNRLARHENYRNYARLFEGWTGAVFLRVPGIGHDGGRMLMSETARRITFH
ncbi:MAG: hypothetical protein JRH19_26930 [Deltaproteobacteria bacterium]|nr:hypothetical protein [Deltaproteobacteria bacterium]